jgi:hypothetical protein
VHEAHSALDAARAAVAHAAVAAATAAKGRGKGKPPVGTAPTTAKSVALASRPPRPVGAALLAAPRRWPRAVRLLLAGAAGGAVSKTATAPIELIRLQVMVGAKAPGAAPLRIGDVVRNTWAHGGAKAFFKGNGVNVMRTVPTKAIQFASFDAYKKLLRRKNKATGALELPPWGGSVAGAAAGVTSTVMCHPLETVQTRLAVGAYKGIGDCVASILRAGGPKALFAGLGPSVVGIIPYSGINLGAYDALRWAYMRSTKTERVPNGVALALGALAGVTAATATFPLEVVRRRMMVGAVSGGTLAALGSIAKAEGVGALFAGCSLNFVKLAPASGLSIYAYESAKEALGVN